MGEAYLHGQSGQNGDMLEKLTSNDAQHEFTSVTTTITKTEPIKFITYGIGSVYRVEYFIDVAGKRYFYTYKTGSTRTNSFDTVADIADTSNITIESVTWSLSEDRKSLTINNPSDEWVYYTVFV